MEADGESGQQLVNRLRIAIALAALRYKPADCSYKSYVLDLQAKFPVPNGAPVSCEQDEWRRRALLLENDLKQLQAKYDGEHIELLSLRDARPMSEAATDLASTGGSKKKQKKKPNIQTDAPQTEVAKADLKTILGGVKLGVDIPRILSSRHAFSSLDVLDTLVSMRARQKTAAPDELFVAVVKRSLEALGTLLATVLAPNYVGCVDALTALATLTQRLLATTLPILSKRKQGVTATDSQRILEDILGQLADSVFVPLIRSFAPLSRTYLSALFLAKKTKKPQPQVDKRHEQIDIRPDVFAAFEMIFSALEILTAKNQIMVALYQSIIKPLLTLEAIRELQELHVNIGTTTATAKEDPSRKLQTTDRLENLVRKDALWYLCNVLRLVLPPNSGTSLPETQRGQDTLLEETIYATLSALLRGARSRPTAHHRAGIAPLGGMAQGKDEQPAEGPSTPELGPRYGMDEVERGMVLAVIERAWLGM